MWLFSYYLAVISVSNKVSGKQKYAAVEGNKSQENFVLMKLTIYGKYIFISEQC